MFEWTPLPDTNFTRACRTISPDAAAGKLGDTTPLCLFPDTRAAFVATEAEARAATDCGFEALFVTPDSGIEGARTVPVAGFPLAGDDVTAVRQAIYDCDVDSINLAPDGDTLRGIYRGETVSLKQRGRQLWFADMFAGFVDAGFADDPYDRFVAGVHYFHGKRRYGTAIGDQGFGAGALYRTRADGHIMVRVPATGLIATRTGGKVAAIRGLDCDLDRVHRCGYVVERIAPYSGGSELTLAPDLDSYRPQE